MCFIKWNLGCWGRSPGRLCLTSETSVKSSWAWNKQVGGLLCSCKLSFAHSSKSRLRGVLHQETPQAGELMSLWILLCRVEGTCPARFYRHSAGAREKLSMWRYQSRKSTCSLPSLGLLYFLTSWHSQTELGNWHTQYKDTCSGVFQGQFWVESCSSP